MADVTASAARNLALSRGEDDRVRLKIVTVTLPASYTTNGDGLLGTGFTHILGVVPISGTGGYMAGWIKATQKLAWYTGDYDPAADSPLVQVDNATDLSAITVDLLVIGW